MMEFFLSGSLPLIEFVIICDMVWVIWQINFSLSLYYDAQAAKPDFSYGFQFNIIKYSPRQSFKVYENFLVARGKPEQKHQH